jgi:hypothetical protein
LLEVAVVASLERWTSSSSLLAAATESTPESVPQESVNSRF